MTLRVVRYPHEDAPRLLDEVALVLESVDTGIPHVPASLLDGARPALDGLPAPDAFLVIPGGRGLLGRLREGVKRALRRLVLHHLAPLVGWNTAVREALLEEATRSRALRDWLRDLDRHLREEGARRRVDEARLAHLEVERARLEAERVRLEVRVAALESGDGGRRSARLADAEGGAEPHR